MGSVYHKTATKPLFPNAEIIVRNGERIAKWKDRRGKTKSAPVTTGRDGSDRIVITARTYTAKYRDGEGIVREVPTGCRDETAAKSVLSELERRAELVKAGVISSSEDSVGRHQQTALVEHIDAYHDHQVAKDLNKDRINNTQSRLARVATDCSFRRLSEVSVAAFENWLKERKDEGMSAGARNGFREACVAFGNWCVRANRMTSNPFTDVPKADTKADCRRKRRALTEDELHRLLESARRRPLLDAMTVRRGKNKGKPIANLREVTRARLELLGWERSLLYKTYLLTGLRKGELKSLTVGQLCLDDEMPYADLDARDEKNREGNAIALRSDLAVDLKLWLARKLELLQVESRQNGSVVPDVLPANTPVFYVPSGLVRILNRDLKLAGIPKVDDRGYTVDVHALRHSFGTHLSKAGVAPRTAQAAMRHSSVDLTMNVYTDPRLLDVHGALDKLPPLPLHGGREKEEVAAKLTGTDDLPVSKFAPGFALTTDNSSKSESTTGKTGGDEDNDDDGGGIVVSLEDVKRKKPLSTADNDSSKSGRLDSNQRPLRPERSALARLSHAPPFVSAVDFLNLLSEMLLIVSFGGVIRNGPPLIVWYRFNSLLPDRRAAGCECGG